MKNLSMVLLPAASLFLILPIAPAAPKPFTISDEARLQLTDAKALASKISSDADMMESAEFDADTSHELQKLRLLSLTDDINSMGKEMARLESESPALPAWERNTVNAVVPMLKDVARSAQEAIDFAKDHPTYLWSREFRGYIENTVDEANYMARALGEHLQLAKAHQQEEQISKDLAVTGGN